MAAEGKDIMFYRWFFFHFVSIDERLAVGFQPNLVGRSKVV